ncbi:MAG: redoxin domain-containing protein [Pirellulales bacterium]
MTDDTVPKSNPPWKRRMLWSVLPVVVALIALGWWAVRAKTHLRVGDAAPEFSLPGTDGELHSSAGLRGRTYVIAWYPKAFTPACTSQCKSLGGSRRLHAFDAVVFAASCDDFVQNQKFADSVAADFPILSDPDGKAAAAFGVKTPIGFASRTLFIVGPDGKILDIEDSPNTADQAGELADKFERLGVPKKT